MKFTITLRGKPTLWEKKRLGGFALLQIVFEYLKECGIEFNEESVANIVRPIDSEFENYHILELDYLTAKRLNGKYGWFEENSDEKITIVGTIDEYIKPEIKVQIDGLNINIKNKWVVDEESVIKALLDGRLEFEPSK